MLLQITYTAYIYYKQVMWLVVTKVRSASFGLVMHVQHIIANTFNFLVTWGLLVTVFHSTCIFCVYSMTLYWSTLQFYLCMYVSFVCQYVVGAPWWALLQHCVMLRRLFDYFSSSSVVPHAFTALCVYPHPLGYLCAKFCFFRGLHSWASPWRKIAYSPLQSLNHPTY